MSSGLVPILVNTILNSLRSAGSPVYLNVCESIISVSVGVCLASGVNSLTNLSTFSPCGLATPFFLCSHKNKLL